MPFTKKEQQQIIPQSIDNIIKPNTFYIKKVSQWPKNLYQ